jgi:hypothetical protein
MAVSPRFDPIFPAHAIERCGITIAFRELVPQKAFERFVGRAAQVAARKGFQQFPGAQVGITVDLLTGKVGPTTQEDQPQSFSLPASYSTPI